MSRSKAAMWLYVGLAALYMVLEVTADHTIWQTVLKGTLMPALLVWAVLALRDKTPRLLVLGLIMATVGDVFLEFDATFLVGMAGFLVMQICYLLGFIRLGAWTQVRRRWPIAVAYAFVWLGANAVIAPAAGTLGIPIAVYSLTLVAMAALASGVGVRVGVGALIFLISDSLIGLDLAGVDFAGRGLVVMGTYLVAQYLIITGWVRRISPEVPIPV